MANFLKGIDFGNKSKDEKAAGKLERQTSRAAKQKARQENRPGGQTQGQIDRAEAQRVRQESRAKRKASGIKTEVAPTSIKVNDPSMKKYNKAVDERTKKTTPNKPVEKVKPEVKKTITKDLSTQTFGQAFKAARKAKGSGKTFTYKGKSYTTNTKEDLAKKSAATKAATAKKREEDRINLKKGQQMGEHGVESKKPR